MVIDTSALIAILFRELDADRLLEAILAATPRLLGAPTAVEASAIMSARRGGPGVVAFQALLDELEIEVVPMTRAAARLASDAYARYGRGVGSPPVLDYGDCLAYGVAADLSQPLLFKGEDFARTDVLAVPY